MPLSARQRHRRDELEQARARLITHLREAVGPALTAAGAQEILEQATAWNSLVARQLDAHLTDNPDALTAPSPHCPLVLIRLLDQLQAGRARRSHHPAGLRELRENRRSPAPAHTRWPQLWMVP